jgi:hypothetical protein
MRTLPARCFAASSPASRISSTPFPPGHRGRLERRVPKDRRVIPVGLQDRKARRAPTETMVRLDLLAWMGLPAPKGRREMKGLRVPKARKGHRGRMVRLDHKARQESTGQPGGPPGPQGPQGPPGQQGIDGTPGAGPQGPPGEVTNAALSVAIAGTSAISNSVALLGLVVSDPPTQAEVQQIADKLDELINALRR